MDLSLEANTEGVSHPVSSGCHVCRELKVVTGEWFLEERSKRFEQGVPCSDVIKHTILSSPQREFARYKSHYATVCDVLCNFIIDFLLISSQAADKKSTLNMLTPYDVEATDTPRSTRSTILSVVDGARRRG